MRKTIWILLLLAFLLPAVGFAQTPTLPDGVKNLQLFPGKLLKSTYCSLDTTTVVCPTDATSTGTHSAYYLPDNVNPPYLIRIQNKNDNPLYYAPYSLNATLVSVILPTSATSPVFIRDFPYNGATDTVYLDDGEAWEKFVYNEPNFVIGGGGSACTFTVEIWK